MKFSPKPYSLRIAMRKLWFIESNAFSKSIASKSHASIMSKIIRPPSPLNRPIIYAVLPGPIKNGSTF